MPLTRKDIFDLVYGPATGGRRFTQDSPVLPDVWLEFGLYPGEARDLLLTPFSIGDVRTPPGVLANTVRRLLREDRQRKGKKRPPAGTETALAASPDLAAGTSFNQSTVAAHMTFREMCRCILPLSKWWVDRICGDAVQSGEKAPSRGRAARRPAPLKRPITGDFGARLRQGEADIARRLSDFNNFRGALPQPADILWLVHIVGCFAFVEDPKTRDTKPEPLEIVRKAAEVFDGVTLRHCQPTLYSVSLNRRVKLSAAKRRAARPPKRAVVPGSANGPIQDPGPVVSAAAVASIKADAAIRLFALNCSDLTWAVIDSGIDATHPCFRKRDMARGGQLFEHPFVRDSATGTWTNQTRVVATYDFTLLRRIMTDDDSEFEKLPARIKNPLKQEQGRIRQSLLSGAELNWEVLAPYLAITHDGTYRDDSGAAKDHVPKLEHGTHVAGLLGGDWRPKDVPVSLRPDPPAKKQSFEPPVAPPATGFAGVCPDINLYDLRILNEEGIGDEFTVMAALQFVRYLNSHQDYPTINGVNISLSIPHEVANYACGRTPVCEECERVVANGTIVVAAAGNDGYLHYSTMTPEGEGRYEGYQTVSITDPGNAGGVITVGSTHREAPHTYGVSYFSSRGPTGDGRFKPDLVAPGEKINGPTPNGGMRWLDGTSMAAPHVSGAAALLIARHRELAGLPWRIKKILAGAATDLGRERYFQGAGMLDVLRAIQSV
jgi:subtilisin family serine protease